MQCTSAAATFSRNFAVASWIPTAHKGRMGELKEEEMSTLLKSFLFFFFFFFLALVSLPFLSLVKVVGWVRGDVWTILEPLLVGFTFSLIYALRYTPSIVYWLMPLGVFIYGFLIYTEPRELN